MGLWLSSRELVESRSEDDEWTLNVVKAGILGWPAYQGFGTSRIAGSAAVKLSGTGMSGRPDHEMPRGSSHQLGNVETSSRTFMDLPRELRDNVYGFVQPGPIDITDARENWTSYALSRVSPTISAEFREFYFKNRVFMLDARTRRFAAREARTETLQ
ncbi:hypothetical protein LTR53_015486 [Teratosphaeriaceae sp. CCFEE 6253]|nr:hypothetical protein LTR53_015486 [Teratosphaeriaceae sp. CCFEE 6253]